MSARNSCVNGKLSLSAKSRARSKPAGQARIHLVASHARGCLLGLSVHRLLVAYQSGQEGFALQPARLKARAWQTRASPDI
jgi:hypothetical protein